MKASVFAVFLVIAGAYAMPPQEIETTQERIVTGQIRRAIEELSRNIKEAGLDPLIVDSFEHSHVVVPFLVEVSGFIDSLEFIGASNIAINNLDYSILFSRFRFDLALPQMRLSVGNSGINAVVFGARYDGSFSGSLSINQIRLAGEARINVGIISGISIRSLSLQFTLGGIDSDLTLVALGTDYSDDLNTVLNVTIPETLLQYRAEINKYLEDLFMSILEQIL